jgi:hypothetical protein
LGVFFSQYIVIWSANLPEEITWYLHRQRSGWFWVATVLISFQFALPFLVLLGRRNKQRLDWPVCRVSCFWRSAS